jgi:DNA-directed RNA polymerase subunit RPC12/RpoP
MKTIYPDGDTMLKCEWCGIRVVTKRRERTLEELAQEHSTGAL